MIILRKDISGYSGYEVDSAGYVISKERMISPKNGSAPYKLPERILKTTLIGKGYMCVCLRRNGKSDHLYVHRLVAESFIPNPNGYKVVNHIDGDKLNNSVDNLEWCSYAENNQHAYDTGLHGRGSKHYRSKLSEDDVIKIKHLYFIDKVSIPDICKMFDYVHRASIHDILKGKTWKHITDY